MAVEVVYYFLTQQTSQFPMGLLMQRWLKTQILQKMELLHFVVKVLQIVILQLALTISTLFWIPETETVISSSQPQTRQVVVMRTATSIGKQPIL